MPERQQHDQPNTYIIPPNFAEAGTFFGGMFRARNVVEALVLVLAAGYPVLRLPLPLTGRIIGLCLTALPLGFLGLVGIQGESLSSFLFGLLTFLKKRRVLGDAVQDKLTHKRRRYFPAAKQSETFSDRRRPKAAVRPPKQPLSPAEYLPVRDIKNGVIHTEDHRFIKVLELTPVNFLLRSPREQRSIIYAYISFLKVSPVKTQIKVKCDKADMSQYLQLVDKEIEKEKEPKCVEFQKDYREFLRTISAKEGIARRFYLILEYEGLGGRRDSEEDAVLALRSAVATAKTFFQQCGNDIIEPENEDEATAEILYELLHRGEQKPFRERVEEVLGKYVFSDSTADSIPVTEFFAPSALDFTHAKYIGIGDKLFSYLLIPSAGYKSRVSAGWLSLLINAGEGIDLDLFMYREARDRMLFHLGRKLRINRSKLQDASDSNTDFDDLSHSIQAGYYLKDGLSNQNEDFYYINILITVTADTVEELEWRISELKKLLASQDIHCSPCWFREEAAFLSSLPLCRLEKHLYNRSKRNALTSGVASCYPFISFEMIDEDGVFMGLNKHNGSLALMNPFDLAHYKSASIAILGSTGVGKTYTLQLLATRIRRKGVQVFIVVPVKGHEFRRCCENIGGEFVEISAGSPACINIMQIRKRETENTDLLDGSYEKGSLLADKIQTLHTFFSLLIPDLSYEEERLLDSALTKTYAQKGITHDNASLLQPDGQYKEMPILEDLYNVLVASPDTKRLANMLDQFVHGSVSAWNQQTNVRLENKYIVFDLSRIPPPLMVPAMFIVVDLLSDMLTEDRTQLKMIFFPEIWMLIGSGSNRLVATYILKLFKTIRGLGGGCVADTQDLGDFFALDDGKYGRAILNACKTKIILNMEDDEARRVQETLNLSEEEVMAITHFPRGSGLVTANNNHVIIDFRASALENQLITTDPHELREMLEQKKRKKSRKEAQI